MVIKCEQIYANLLITVCMMVDNETDFHKSVNYIVNGTLLLSI